MLFVRASGDKVIKLTRIRTKFARGFTKKIFQQARFVAPRCTVQTGFRATPCELRVNPCNSQAPP